jgi:hypothetical protein
MQRAEMQAQADSNRPIEQTRRGQWRSDSGKGQLTDTGIVWELSVDVTVYKETLNKMEVTGEQRSHC